MAHQKSGAVKDVPVSKLERNVTTARMRFDDVRERMQLLMDTSMDFSETIGDKEIPWKFFLKISSVNLRSGGIVYYLYFHVEPVEDLSGFIGKCSLRIMDGDGNKELKNLSTQDFKGRGKPSFSFSSGTEYYHYNTPGSMVIEIKLTRFSNKSVSASKVDVDTNALQLQGACILEKDFKAMFKAKQMSDFTIQCGDEEFYCNKNILCNRFGSVHLDASRPPP